MSKLELKDKAEIAAYVAIIIALCFNITSIRLQKKALDLNVFNRTMESISHKLDDIPTQGATDADLYKWYVTMLSTLDRFAFYANEEYIRSEMVEYEEDFIIKECDAISKECPKLVEEYKSDPKKLKELRKFYRNSTGKECPL